MPRSTHSVKPSARNSRLAMTPRASCVAHLVYAEGSVSGGPNPHHSDAFIAQ
ncbi:hypothetical protein BDW62DRAFT_183914 [Aspergillus aurantiobrunneus]